MKQHLKIEAMRMRRTGMTYASIARHLAVSKSTVSVWLANMPLTDAEKENVTLQYHRARQLARAKAIRSGVLKRQAAKEQMQFLVEQNLKSYTSTTIDTQIQCSLLYWAEGGKDTGNGVSFINSDPLMIRLFMSLFRHSFDIDERKFRVMLHVHDYHHVANQISFWSETTNILPKQFYRPYLKPHTGKRNKAGYQGCISVRYLDATVAKQLTMIYKLFAENTLRGVR